MRALAALVTRNRSRAVMVTAVCAMLALIFPPFAYLSAAAVALVTLRQGASSGLLVIILSGVGLAVLGYLAFRNPAPAFSFLLVLWLPVWLIAMVLRSTVSLALAMEAAALMAAVMVVAVYLIVGDPAPLWRGALETVVVPAMESSGLGPDVAGFDAALDNAAALMNGVMATILLLSLVLSLLLARWWQAQLFNPGGFRGEFHALRLHRGVAVAGLLVLAGAWVLSGTPARIAGDLAMPTLVMFLFQGLAVVHGLVQSTSAHTGWLVGLYALMAVALPQVVLVVGLLGLTDAFMDFRGRFGHKKTTSND